MKHWMNSLIIKIGTIVVVVESIVLLSIGFFYSRQFSAEINSRMNRQVYLPGKLMNRQLLRYESVSDKVVMNALLGEEFVDGLVVDGNGKVFYALNAECIGKNIQDLPGFGSVMINRSETEPRILKLRENDNDFLLSIMPLVAYENAKPFFFSCIKVNTAVSKKTQQEVFRLFVFGSIFCMAVTSIIIILLTRSIVIRPLKKLEENAEQLAKGDLEQTIDLSRHDELGSLAESFSKMRDAIRSQIKQMASFNRDLEKTVAERTHDLNQNMQLLKQEIEERINSENEKTELSVRLQRAQKMEAIGTLAGGVAHDLNNILSGIVSYPELLLMELPCDSPLRKPVLTIQKSGEKAAAIVQDLLTLARRGVTVTENIRLNDMILDYLRSPEFDRLQQYHEHASVITDFDDDLMPISGSPVHISKTVMNLVSNAMEAMTEPGTVRIQTRNQYVDSLLKGYDAVEEGEYVVLIVSDSGEGISAEDKERVFEPFYTKKKMGRSGTGLGLAVVWGVVKDHRGYIEIESQIGKGTTFKIYFPIARGAMQLPMQPESEDDYRGRGESVLVVDDVAEQREIASAMLEKLGYHVTAVPSGEAAVEWMKTRRVDILVLDMIMDPGLDGLETYEQILKIHPGQKAIIASGFSETERVRAALKAGAGEYLRKPYLIKNIGAAVRAVLDQEKTGGGYIST